VAFGPPTPSIHSGTAAPGSAGLSSQQSRPTLRALAVEDAAALVGVAIAALGLLVRELGGPSSSDAIASLLIGILLAITVVCLARPLADLLIGRSLAPERLQKARSIIEWSPAIDHVLNL